MLVWTSRHPTHAGNPRIKFNLIQWLLTIPLIDLFKHPLDQTGDVLAVDAIIRASKNMALNL